MFNTVLQPVKKLWRRIPIIKRYRDLIDKSHLNLKCCEQLLGFQVLFNSIDSSQVAVKLCCATVGGAPAFPLCDTGEDTIQSLFYARAAMIAESVCCSLAGHPSAESKRDLTKKCLECNLFMDMKTPPPPPLIGSFNLGLFPSPCNCRCVYCTVDKYGLLDKELTHENYEKVFSAIEYAFKENLVADTVWWTVAPGEITVHPYRNRIYPLVGTSSAIWHTNCIVYSEEICKNLLSNPSSRVNFSIDCGTSETWEIIKRVGNFEKVIANIRRYMDSGVNPNQFLLKYIIIPGVNDNEDEYLSTINLLKKLAITRLTISYDFRIHDNTSYDRESIIKSAREFVTLLANHEVECDFTANFTLDEQARISGKEKKY